MLTSILINQVISNMRIEKNLEIQEEIESCRFTIVAKDMMRPWGAFLVIEEEEAQDFAQKDLTCQM